jgi:hypothetical protein
MVLSMRRAHTLLLLLCVVIAGCNSQQQTGEAKPMCMLSAHVHVCALRCSALLLLLCCAAAPLNSTSALLMPC